MRNRPSPLMLLIVLPLLLGCGAEGDGLPAGEDFGAGLTLVRPTPLAEISREPERFEGETILIHGEVTDVCQKKGCWTVIRQGEDHVRVRFENYGFFLPKDCVGAEAWAQGSIAAVTPPEREIRFTATGVRLVGGN
jgi:hypothetical protein